MRELHDIDGGQRYGALQAFLETDRSPTACMMLSDLEGFLTGIVVGPELIQPSEWLPVIWRGKQPAFVDSREAADVIGAIMGRHNEILGNVRRGTFEPILGQIFEDAIIAADWADGFASAMGLRSKSWEPLFRDEKHATLLFPILALWTMRMENRHSGSTQKPKSPMEAALKLIPDCVLGIAAFWLERRPGAISHKSPRRRAYSSCAEEGRETKTKRRL